MEIQFMKISFIKIGKVALAALALTIISACQSANAASIKLEVKVPGVTGWVLVKEVWPKYGGRVVYDASLGCNVTDDVARGETMRITATPTAGDSTAFDASALGIYCASKSKYIVFSPVTLPCQFSGFVVPLDQSLDSLYVDVYASQLFSKRIPIGPRFN
jgi:hypothetical protein